VRNDVNLLAEQQPRVEIVDVNGSPGERFDQMLLYGRETVLAS
jgi:hypothetical protein